MFKQSISMIAIKGVFRNGIKIVTRKYVNDLKDWQLVFFMNASFLFLDRLITYDTKVLQLQQQHCMFK